MRADQERVRTLLCDTVKLLCKNGLAYDKELRVQGLLGITLDESDVFIVHINERMDNKSSLEDRINNEGCDVTDLVRNQISKSLQLQQLSQLSQLGQLSPSRERTKRSQDSLLSHSGLLNHLDEPPHKKPFLVNNNSVLAAQNNNPASHPTPPKRGRKKKRPSNSFNAAASASPCTGVTLKGPEDADDEELVLIGSGAVVVGDNNNCGIKDDRNAMLDMYGDDELTDLPDLPTPPSTQGRSRRKNAHPTQADITDIPPPPLTLYGEHNSSNHSHDETAGIPEFTDDDELKAPDPTMGGPFIAGIVQQHHSAPVTSAGSDGSEDRSWEDLGQIGPLTQDGQVVLEGTGSWEEATRDDTEDKLNTQQRAAESASPPIISGLTPPPLLSAPITSQDEAEWVEPHITSSWLDAAPQSGSQPAQVKIEPTGTQSSTHNSEFLSKSDQSQNHILSSPASILNHNKIGNQRRLNHLSNHAQCNEDWMENGLDLSNNSSSDGSSGSAKLKFILSKNGLTDSSPESWISEISDRKKLNKSKGIKIKNEETVNNCDMDDSDALWGISNNESSSQSNSLGRIKSMLEYKSRRSPYSSDKSYRCTYQGCGKTFFESKNLRRHETIKHGRVPTYRRKPIDEATGEILQ